MIRSSFAILLLLVAFAGCTYPSIKKPLVDPVKAVAFPELIGTYTSTNPKTGEQAWLHIGLAGEGFPSGFHKLIWIMSTPERGIQSTELICFYHKIGDSFILHIPLEKDGHLDSQAKQFPKGWDAFQVDTYLFARMAKTEVGMTLHLLNEDFIAAKVESGEMSGRIDQIIDATTDPPTIGKRTVWVDAGTEQLRTLFESAPLDKLFDPPVLVFKQRK